MKTLLPPNATKLERCIFDAFCAVVSAKKFDLSTLWQSEHCPVEFLPYLASSMRVPFSIYNQLSNAKRRAYIESSIDIHRRKGTLGGLQKALQLADYSISVKEWYQYGGTPHTVKVSIAKQSKGIFDLALVGQVIEDNKNVQTCITLSTLNSMHTTLFCLASSTVSIRAGMRDNHSIAQVMSHSTVRLHHGKPFNQSVLYALNHTSVTLKQAMPQIQSQLFHLANSTMKLKTN